MGEALGTAKEAAGRKGSWYCQGRNADTGKEGNLILARKEGWYCQGSKADTGKEGGWYCQGRKLAKEAPRLMG